MLSVLCYAPAAIARSAGGLAAAALVRQARFIQVVPTPAEPGNADYDADWKSLKGRLLKLPTPPLCDVDRKLRTVSPKIFRVNPNSAHNRFAGPARTVQCREDLLSVVIGLRDAQEGEVLVIDTQHSQRAVFGELFASEARRKKLAAVIIEGGVRDVDRIREMDIPVYARFITPMAGSSYKIFSQQTIVNCGSIHIAPGEIVVGDHNGIVVGSMEEFARIVPAAEKLEAIEGRVLDKLAQGVSLMDMMNIDHHVECIKNNTPSLLAYNKDLQ